MTVREEASLKNAFLVYLIFASAFAAFFWGGYYILNPTLFLVGLFLSSVVCVWASMQLKFANLMVMMSVTLATAVVDEYAHTSAGTFAYFDGGLPSPLTVFGWGLFILVMLTVARYLNRLLLWRIQDGMAERLVPVMATICLLLVSMGFQGYLSRVSWLLAGVYVLMCLASLYYSLQQKPGWNVSVMISSLLIGVAMESLGALEGMWQFGSMEPLLLFMAFTWSLRTWTILSISKLLYADFQI